ncbi:MAG: hypothetical protein QY310_15980 [Candidatus Jettenia sp. CY-1]|nr:MAG: hypothetical protein QY310_15980 [Candidatus Jettenia sp. CY-1]
MKNIQTTLLEHGVRGQPVFLYGSNAERIKLILEIHKQRGGIEATWEYTGLKKEIQTELDIDQKIKKAVKEGNLDIIHNLLKNTHNTHRTS